jgi:hypothetical protein
MHAFTSRGKNQRVWLVFLFPRKGLLEEEEPTKARGIMLARTIFILFWNFA